MRFQERHSVQPLRDQLKKFSFADLQQNAVSVDRDLSIRSRSFFAIDLYTALLDKATSFAF